jgi:hypothetical protein
VPGIGIPLGGRHFEPVPRLLIVLRHALPRAVQVTQLVLGVGMVDVGGLLQPHGSGRVVLRHAFPLPVEHTDGVERFPVDGQVGRYARPVDLFFPLGHGLFVIARLVGIEAGLVVGLGSHCKPQWSRM